MMRIKTLLLAALFVSTGALAQSCPKVSYTTQAATLRSLVTTVNCLVSSAEKTRTLPAETIKGGLAVDSIQVVGPQHSRSYRKIVLALLSVPVGSEVRTALVTPDSPQGSVTGTAGASCQVKINPGNTVDAQCNLTGGTLYIVYQN